jgi:valine dehydrogenase (NAD+)
MIFEQFEGHEQVVVGHDAATGLRAIVALHSTVLGPGLGGTRCYPYPDDAAALADVLHLSRAMTYKNSLAGLPLGGGKAVIIADPQTDKTEALLLAYGRFLQTLGGRYITAGDVGTYVADLDVMSRECQYVTGRSPELGGAGDSSILTAHGVFRAMQACAEHRWGTRSLAGRRVGVSGLGKVGHRLVAALVEDGAQLLVTDVNPDAVAQVVARHPGVEVVADTQALLTQPLDVFSPNALGGAITDSVAATIAAAVVCGGANNQLADPEAGQILARRGVLYGPDFCVNAGGVIQVADELDGFSFERARARADRIFDTTAQILTLAHEEGIVPVAAAERIAEQRIERRRAELAGG